MSYFNFTDAFTAHLTAGKKRTVEEATEIVDAVKSRLVMLEKRDYWVAGYGSILNERSREKTMPNAKTAVPAYVKGWERIFNLDCTTQTVLNVQPTKNRGQKLPVVAVKVPYGDMFDFILRERNYDIKEVPLYSEKGEVLDEKAIMVVATNKEQLADWWPNMEYLQANIFGANELGGDDFVEKYLDTTYFYSDNKLTKTSIREYISPYAVEHFKEVDSWY